MLLVDDNVDAVDLLAELLRLRGFDVRVAYSGDDALATLRAFPPAIAVFDIGLPGIDGYQLAARAHAELPGLPLIALSGYGLPADRERSASAGVSAHLTKPAELDALLDLIESLVRRG